MTIYRILKKMLPKSIKRPIKRWVHKIWLRENTIIGLLLKEKLGQNIFFVQIGSNDGKQGDPLYDLIKMNKSWRGIFVEPIPFLFRRLKQNYADEDRFTFINVAISEVTGDRDFFYVAKSARESLDLPFWYDQLGSFDPNHIRKHFGDEITPFIVCEKISCQTLSEVFLLNSVENIDLLHIDTEGFDYKILRQVDFTYFQPKIIIYEHKHLPDKERQASSDLLKANGYNCIEAGGDTFGVRR